MPKVCSSALAASGPLASIPYNAAYNRLKNQQRLSFNITTCKNGLLIQVPYPVQEDGTPVRAVDFLKYSLTHTFDLPQCFHEVPARIFKVMGNGELAGKTLARCGHKTRSCGFWICFDELLEDDFAVKYLMYSTRRVPQLQLALAGSEGLAPNTTTTGATAGQPATPSSSQVSVLSMSQSPCAPRNRVSTSSGLGNDPSAPQWRGPTSSSQTVITSAGGGTPSIRVASSSGSSTLAFPGDVSPSKGTTHHSLNSMFSGYTLDLPPAASQSYPAALALWSPPLGVDAIVGSGPFAGGTMLSLLDLNMSYGMPAKKFWNMFVICHGCDHIMVNSVLPKHVCDLSSDDDE
ncbi:hypothetical protein B0H21DRAFT_824037 [Amylocystis lapponica]|nr:hypothetical protein B0H21DRAFT_824037 [Amylocystis lapponica]